MNTKNFFSALVLTVCSTLAFANTSESSMAVVAGNSASIFKVVYKSASTNRVQLTILNNSNEVVFTETLNKMNGFVRPYNFSALPEGEYTIELLDSNGKKVEKVNYSLGTVKSLIKVSKLVNEKSKFMLSVANQGANEINVAIYSASGDLLHNDSRSVSGDFAIVYNLVEAGSYTFVVSDKDGNTRTIQF